MLSAADTLAASVLAVIAPIATHAAVALASVGSAIADWFAEYDTALVTVAVILVVAAILNFVVRRTIRATVERLVKASEARRERAEREDEAASQADDGTSAGRQTAERLRSATLASERAEQRMRTVGSLLRYVATITIWTVAVLMALAELGISIAPLIASAGIAGVALGFGAQSLVRDFLSGIFMLLEDQYGVGDVVDLGEASGTVERVTLRVTTVRGTDGTVWYVPNGQVMRVGNQSQRWSRTIMDIEVAYDTDIDAASAVIKRVADDFWREQVAGAMVIEEPEVWGVQNVSPVAVVLRLAVKTRPGEQWAAGRALRARLKAAFDEAGIATPQPVPTAWMPSAPGNATDAAALPPSGAPS